MFKFRSDFRPGSRSGVRSDTRSGVPSGARSGVRSGAGSGAQSGSGTGAPSGSQSGSGSGVSIPRRTDLVLITWTRNPLVAGSPRRVMDSRVIGSARPCEFFLQPGTRLRAALNCLTTNGFVIVVQRNTTAVTGLVLLQRTSARRS